MKDEFIIQKCEVCDANCVYVESAIADNDGSIKPRMRHGKCINYKQDDIQERLRKADEVLSMHTDIWMKLNQLTVQMHEYNNNLLMLKRKIDEKTE